MNIQKAQELCRLVEPLLEAQGFHVGLTGGVLYKEGERKDVDLIVDPIVDKQSHKFRTSFENCLDVFRNLGFILDAHPADVDNYSGSPVGIFSHSEYGKVDVFCVVWTDTFACPPKSPPTPHPAPANNISHVQKTIQPDRRLRPGVSYIGHRTP